MMTDFPLFNGDTGNFIVFIRKMNPSSLYSFRMGQALCLELWTPWRVRHLSLSSWSSRPSWEMANKESTTKTIKAMINPMPKMSTT